MKTRAAETSRSFPSLAELLTSEQIERTHQASLEILESIGLEVNNARAREIFRRHGCRIADDGLRVTFPPEVVTEPPDPRDPPRM